MVQIFKYTLSVFLLTSLLLGDISTGDNLPQLVFRSTQGKLFFVNDYVGEARMLNASAERIPVVLIFFRSDDHSSINWLPGLAKKGKESKIKIFFIAVDESGEEISNFRKTNKLRAAFLIDKYGSSAEQLDLLPIDRFSNAPTAVLVQQSGDVSHVFKDFTSKEISNIIESAKENLR